MTYLAVPECFAVESSKPLLKESGEIGPEWTESTANNLVDDKEKI